MLPFIIMSISTDIQQLSNQIEKIAVQQEALEIEERKLWNEMEKVCEDYLDPQVADGKLKKAKKAYGAYTSANGYAVPGNSTYIIEVWYGNKFKYFDGRGENYSLPAERPTDKKKAAEIDYPENIISCLR